MKRRGFSLIEILVVIGIIMILVSILFYSFRSMNRTAAGNETRAELTVCTGMLAEYEGRNGLAGIEAVRPNPDPKAPPQASDPGAPPQTPGLFPVYVDPAAQIDATNKTLTTPGAVGTWWPSLQLVDVQSGSLSDMGDRSNSNGVYTPRYFSAAVPATLDVMYVLMRIPANQSLAQGIDAKRILEPLPPKDSPSPPPNPVAQGVVLLDGWANPILFVPRAGMHVLIAGPHPQKINPPPPPHVYIVRSTGSIDLGPQGSQKPDPALTGSERPFFASAGPDGDFTQGEDNVYSFNE